MNNAKNVAFLFWSYFDYVMLIRRKDTRLSVRYIFTFWESLGTRLAKTVHTVSYTLAHGDMVPFRVLCAVRP